jgi:hypothetical protein
MRSDFHNKNYGGARPRSGRKKIGEGSRSKALRITLPGKDWEYIEGLIAAGRVASYAEYFRDLHDSSFKKNSEV